MKQTLLKDIELDIEQLKCLVNAVDTNYNPILCKAAQRSIIQMKERLDTLFQELEKGDEKNPLVSEEIKTAVNEDSEEENEAVMEETISLINAFEFGDERTDVVESAENDKGSQTEQQQNNDAIKEELIEEELKIALETVLTAKEYNPIEEKREVMEEPLQDELPEVIPEDNEFEEFDEEDEEDDEEYEEYEDDEEEDEGDTSFKTENEPLPVKEEGVTYRREQEVVTSTFIPVSDVLTTDLRQFITLNDTFRFTRELFEGDSARMKETIEQLDKLTSFDEALTYMESVMTLDEEDEATQDFIDILKKRFNR